MLTTSEIEARLRGVRYFKGVFACDRLPIRIQAPATLVINTDPAADPGEHWVSVHVRRDYRVDYFDPFGFPPLIPEIQAFAYRNGWSGQRYNTVTLQDASTSLCGDYCIAFVQAVAQGEELPDFVARFALGASQVEK